MSQPVEIVLVDTEKSNETHRFIRFIQEKFNVMWVYDSIHEALRYVSKLDDELIFMVLAQPLDSQLTDASAESIELQKVNSIYILAAKAADQGKWPSAKTPQYFADQESLAAQLIRVRAPFELHTDNSSYHLHFKSSTLRTQPLPMSILRSVDDEKTLTKLDDDSVKYIWYFLFFDSLNQMIGNDSESARKEMITMCRKDFLQNETEEGILDEFENSYTPEAAVFWYTRLSFIHRELDEAFRFQDISRIFKFRYFIDGLRTQLGHVFHKDFLKAKNYKPFELRVYRGQKMQQNELSNLGKNCDKLMCVSSFFSTTEDKEIALRYMKEPSSTGENMRKVLFVIDSSTEQAASQPFAKVHSLSVYTEKGDVLFTAGTIFKIESVQQIVEEDFYIIYLRLHQKNVQEIKNIVRRMENQGKDEATFADEPFIIFIDFLIDLGKSEDAQNFCEKMLENIEPKHYGEAIHDIYNSVVHLYNKIGQSHFSKGDYLKARDCYNYAFKVNLQKAPSPITKTEDSKALALTCMNLGLVYFRLSEYRTALRYFQQAKDLRKEVDVDKETKKANDDTARLSRAYSYMALSLKGMGNKAAGLKIAEKAQQYAPKTDSVQGLALLSKAACSSRKKAEEIYMEALRAFESTPNLSRADEVFLYLQIGKFYRSSKAFEKSEGFDKKALAICLKNSENKADIKLCEEYLKLDRNPPVSTVQI